MVRCHIVDKFQQIIKKETISESAKVIFLHHYNLKHNVYNNLRDQ